MVRVFAFALATTALVGCATQAPPPPPVVPAAEVAPPAPPPAPPAPKPQYGAFGFDTAGMDASIAQGDEIGVSPPFRMFVSQDDKDPNAYVLQMSQGGIGMPDRDYYLSADPKL